jgi:flagellar biosynthesis/type III secretory pathway M-ring protein FliF/YscJ
MRGIFLCSAILGGMALIDLWFSSKLLGAVKFAGTVQTLADSGNEIDLVEQALNSRYMQWGAVGVMLMLFVWIIMKHLPNQERRRDAERSEEREAFLESLKTRDVQYLGALSEIRKSVENHVDRNHSANNQLTIALNDLTREIRQTHP